MDIQNWAEILTPYEQAVDELCIKFQSLTKKYKTLEQYSPIEQVDGRVKKIGSILEKAHRKNIPYDRIEEDVEDIAGIRIICRFVEDIDKVVGLIRQRDGYDLKILEERDYITNRKPSGYRSYHIIIKYTVMTVTGLKDVNVEIQIRTLAMNFWATIEHSIRYKYNGNMPEDLQRRLISSAEASFQLDREMGTIAGEIMEAQRIIEQKNNLVDEIVKNINNLHLVAKIDKMNEVNRQFMELYEEGDLERLTAFSSQLKVMAEVYKVQYV